jgi:16S rRNA C967 or C1407 C5-methylase (RsmB/RsmF family)
MANYFEIPVGDEQEQAHDFSDARVEWMNPMPQRYYRKFETDALTYRLKGVVRYDIEDGFSVEFEDYDPQLFDEEEVEALGEYLIEQERIVFSANTCKQYVESYPRRKESV